MIETLWLLTTNIALDPRLPTGELFDSAITAMEHAERQARQPLHWKTQGNIQYVEWKVTDAPIMKSFWLVEIPYHKSEDKLGLLSEFGADLKAAQAEIERLEAELSASRLQTAAVSETARAALQPFAHWGDIRGNSGPPEHKVVDFSWYFADVTVTNANLLTAAAAYTALSQPASPMADVNEGTEKK